MEIDVNMVEFLFAKHFLACWDEKMAGMFGKEKMVIWALLRHSKRKLHNGDLVSWSDI